MEVVDDCPDNEEKWRVAAEKKNCAAYANQCDEPQRLVYHCTINAFSNQTLEMCAYGKYIFKGYCTVYSISGNLIGPSHLTRGSNCPKVYNSSKAFKCQGCYDATKKGTEHISLETNTDPDISAKNKTQTEREPADHDFSNENESQERMQIVYAIIFIVGVILVIVVIIIIIVVYRWKRCFCFSDSHIRRENLIMPMI